MSLKQQYLSIKSSLPEHVELVAVSKTHPIEAIREIYEAGQNIFGENKVQEMVEKHALLPNDIRWHLIGHLQTNKVKYIAPFVDTIQSVDSEKLMTEIDRQAEKYGRKIDVLLQVKIAEEDTKSGLPAEEAEMVFGKWLSGLWPHVTIKGLMGMATFTEDETQIRREFGILKNLFDRLGATHPLETLSMGMSGDYELAIECGANSVRVGSAIFGSRS